MFTDIVRNADVAQKLVEKNYPELISVARRFGYVQRLDYLLHIPLSLMTSENKFYNSVVSHIRRNIRDINENIYLTKKQKAYLNILAPAPRMVRTIHAKLRGL